jgi:hypothetical protein
MAVPDPTCFSRTLTIAGTSRLVDEWFEQAVAASDYNLFQTAMSTCPGGFGYEIRGVSTGTYSAILTTPNYPPYQTTVALTVDGSTTTLDVNLDSAVGAGGSLTGVVTSTATGLAVANAAVSIESPGYKSKTLTTDSAGTYRLDGLPAGLYTVKVVASNYALANVSVSVGAASLASANFALWPANASLTGTVYAQKVPFIKAQPGAKVFAYNDTQNVADPSAELSLYKTVTSSSGFYRFDGLESDKVYKIFMKAPGKYILNQSTRTVAGTRPGIDFTLLSKPLDVEVSGRPTTTQYEFSINNPGDFKTGRAWVGFSPWTLVGSTEVTNSLQSLPNNQLLLSYPLASLTAGTDYVLHIEGVSLAGKTVTKELLFGTHRKGNATQGIDEELLGDDSTDEQGRKSNQVALDDSGQNPSGMSFPVGALIPISTAAIAVCQLSNTAIGASTVAAMVGVFNSTRTFASDGIYHVNLSSVNFTQKGFDLTLAYVKGQSELGDIKINRFNHSTNKWEAVSGQQTIDAVKGTISVRIKSLSSPAGLPASSPMMAMAVNGTYVPNSAYQALSHVVGHDDGDFTVLRPSLVGVAYSGTALKVFNFPNPFNLKSKTVSLTHGGATTSLTTSGTVIKYELPSGVSGHVNIRIYTLAGELVRDLDMGDQTGGSYYYTAWDGKNKSGQNVANGVYYGILSVPGAKTKDGTFKLAVIK